jgi:hypothetical protein
MTKTQEFTPTAYTLTIPDFGTIKVSRVPEAGRWLTMPHAFDSRNRITGVSRFFDTLDQALTYGRQIADKIDNGDL